MRIPRYWARGVQTVRDGAGRPHTFACWQSSDVSVAEAQRQAEARAMKAAALFLSFSIA